MQVWRTSLTEAMATPPTIGSRLSSTAGLDGWFRNSHESRTEKNGSIACARARGNSSGRLSEHSKTSSTPQKRYTIAVELRRQGRDGSDSASAT